MLTLSLYFLGHATCRRSQSVDQRRNRRITLPSSATTSQQTAKSETKILRTECINKRVDSGVAVTKPEEDDEGDPRCTVATENAENVHGEERCPAKHETTDDDSYSFGGFFLAV